MKSMSPKVLFTMETPRSNLPSINKVASGSSNNLKVMNIDEGDGFQSSLDFKNELKILNGAKKLTLPIMSPRN